MGLARRAVALWCAVAMLAGDSARAYTVDCNHEYADCDTELSKIANEDDELLLPSSTTATTKIAITSTPILVTTPKIEFIVNKTDFDVETEPKEAAEPKPKARLLNINVDELQNFANALHNQTNGKNSKKGLDLSDVTLDDDEDDAPKIVSEHKHKNIPDKFYSNLEAPFHHLLNNERGSEELESCKENGIFYKIGDRMERGCEETCECNPGGAFECSPRCKHPFIRRGRRLDDPLCFESPVDECCSIIACASGNSEIKPTKVEVCRYGNDTYAVGAKWHIRCEQTCICEPNSIVTCKPRCNTISLSEKCINVQDPNDACCEVQVCDVSQDVHEEPADNITSTSTTTTTEAVRSYEDFDQPRSTIRPLVLNDPIGSVKVLHNNSVQVNLIHMNDTENPIHLLLSSDGGKNYEDIELKYSNLILNLEGGKDYILKTKETGTKFNFTITATDSGNNLVSMEELGNTTKVGCFEGGNFYAVGEEFHIGCTELCECTGHETRDCAALACPSHVGLELVSKGCVRWEPSPPAHPPNCCPRSARCLSDGTCHFKGVAIPNWSEVPISLTGCEQRCFCENGELDCQEVCSSLPAVPPQNFRCPPLHHPAHVNISDEDCCKQWGCVPNARNQGSTLQIYSMPTLGEADNYVTPVGPILPSITTSVLPLPPKTTDSIDFYRHLTPVKSFPKYLKTVKTTSMNNTPQNIINKKSEAGENITVFTLDDLDSPFKTMQSELPQVKNSDSWNIHSGAPKRPVLDDPNKQNKKNLNKGPPFKAQKQGNLIKFHDKLHNTIQSSRVPSSKEVSLGPFKVSVLNHETVRKVPISQVNNLDLFLPNHDHRKASAEVSFNKFDTGTKSDTLTYPKKPIVSYFEPDFNNTSSNYIVPTVIPNSISNSQLKGDSISGARIHVTILRTKDLKPTKTANNLLNNEALWNPDSKIHVLTKAPNPYETVLHRLVPNTRTQLIPTFNQNVKVPQLSTKTYSSLDLERLLSQMEVESEVNRNLGRSADKIQDVAGQSPVPGIPPHIMHPQPPSFLPTIPPEIDYPQQHDIPDFPDIQNNIPRPVHPLEPGLPNLPPRLDVNKKLKVISLEADSPTSVKMLFGLPPVLVGLRGSVDLRYTDEEDEEISNWYSQVFAPEDEILTTNRLDFRLTGLKPSTTYKIRGKLYLHNLPVEPESDIYSIRTQDLPTVRPTVEERRREINSKLTLVDVNDTTAEVSWRHFTEDELQYIDGIQVRYRPVGTPIYSMTELLHHSRSAAELHDLHSGNRYEASLVLIPPPRARTELYDPGQIEFTTLPFIDPYNWSVVVEARIVGSEAVELTWSGVPSPAERWVRVYRAAHACGPPTAATVGTRKEHDEFRLAARDLPPTVKLTGLEPESRCRVWLELFLTNGKVKTSNVLEINTKSLDSPETIDNEIEVASVTGGRAGPRGDYYGALVVVGVVAALGALTSLLLLLVVVRRHRPRSVPITPVPTAPRESSLPPYDNPAYKLELQQETMDL